MQKDGIRKGETFCHSIFYSNFCKEVYLYVYPSIHFLVGGPAAHVQLMFLARGRVTLDMYRAYIFICIDIFRYVDNVGCYQPLVLVWKYNKNCAKISETSIFSVMPQ